MDMSEVILNLVPREKRGGGVKPSAVQKIRLKNYSVLFLEVRFGGGVLKR
jgi:hypothetical protein